MKSKKNYLVALVVSCAMLGATTAHAQTDGTATSDLTSGCNNTSGSGAAIGGALIATGLIAFGLCATSCGDSYMTGNCTIGPLQPNCMVGMGISLAVAAEGNVMRNKANQMNNACQAALAQIASNNPTGATGTATTGSATPVAGVTTTTGTGSAGVGVAAAMQKLAAAGIQYNPATGTATLPDGTQVSPASASTMSSPAGQALASALTADANKLAAGDTGVENDTAGDGKLLAGGGKSASGSGSGSGANGAGGVGGAKARNLASASGTTKVTSSGDVIGGAQDDIFAMVSRRFQSVCTQKQLILPGN